MSSNWRVGNKVSRSCKSRRGERQLNVEPADRKRQTLFVVTCLFSLSNHFVPAMLNETKHLAIAAGQHQLRLRDLMRCLSYLFHQFLLAPSDIPGGRGQIAAKHTEPLPVSFLRSQKYDRGSHKLLATPGSASSSSAHRRVSGTVAGDLAVSSSETTRLGLLNLGQNALPDPNVD